MNINDFKGSFNELARNSLFKVDFSGHGINGRNFQFRCKASSLPGTTFTPVEVPYMGRKIKIPGDREYEAWTTTVLLDEDYSLHAELYNWANDINGTTSNVTTGDLNSLKADGIITTLKRDGSNGISYKVVGMWPSAVGPVELTWDGGSEPAEVEITWEVDYFEIN